MQGIDTSIKSMIDTVGKVAASTDQEAEASQCISTLTKSIAHQAKQADSKVQDIVHSLEELDSLASKVTSLVNVFKIEEEAILT